MKTAKLLVPLASAIFALYSASARAQCTNDGPPATIENGDDCFLGFRATSDPGSTQDYLVKIGPASQFTTGAVTLDLGNIAADLVCIFGSQWYTRTDVLWAVVAGDYNTNILYSTNPSQAPYNTSFDSEQGAIVISVIDSMEYGGGGYYGSPTTLNSNGLGTIQDAFGDNSYASYQPPGANSGGASFQFFDPPDEGIPTQLLYFNQLVPSTDQRPGTVLGYFQLSSGGQLTYQPISVPTPTPTPSSTPTPTPSSTPTPSVTPSPTITPSPTVTPTPTATPPTAALGNISTRARVDTGANVLIGGFIITGTLPKKVLVRAIGPSLPVPGKLLDPVLTLFNSKGQTIASNDNWMDAPNRQEIIDSTIPPSDDHESAVLLDLSPDAYTAIVSGVGNSTGIGLVEVYDLDQSLDSQLVNISTRGFVQTGDDVMIGGFILLGSGAQKVLVRAIGPSLPVAGSLPDPVLDLYDANGLLLASNDDWRDTQEAAIKATTIPPTDDAESAVVQTLAPAPYTAIVRGKNGTTGVALIEMYLLSE